MSAIDYGSQFDRDLAARWIDALESDNYHQTTGQLKSTTDYGEPTDVPSYCCLGVLCDLVQPDTWEDDNWIYDGDTWETEPPKELMTRLGFAVDEDRPTARRDGKEWRHGTKGSFSLIEMNDTFHADFATIAANLRDYYGMPPKETT